MIEKDEEFELVPLSPIRRLEKRMEQLETSPAVNAKEFLSEIVDIVKMNQQLVDQLAKADDAMRIEISKLPGKIETLIETMTELLSYIKASAGEEGPSGPAGPSGPSPLAEKIDKLVEANQKMVEHNESMLSALENIGERMRRPLPPMPPKKLIMPPRR